MKIKTIAATTTLLLLATTAFATNNKQELEDKRKKIEEFEYSVTTIIETDPDNPRDPSTGQKDRPDLVDGECHVMPDGHCLFW